MQPTYRLSLLTALAFLIVAPLPLLAHLGHPERCFEMFLTPNLNSAMAMFGFVYAWYLMVVLRVGNLVRLPQGPGVWAAAGKGLRRLPAPALDAGRDDISPGGAALRSPRGPADHPDRHPVGLSAAWLRRFHFRVGQGQSVVEQRADPDRVPFLGDGLGHRAGALLFLVSSLVRGTEIDMPCADKLASFLLYALIVDFSLELLDFIHRLYQAEESIKILSQMIASRLFLSLMILQVLLGTLLPMLAAGLGEPRLPLTRPRPGAGPGRTPAAGLLRSPRCLIQIGIFSTRWNVVIGGQLFSKSLRGLTVYKTGTAGGGGLLHVHACS